MNITKTDVLGGIIIFIMFSGLFYVVLSMSNENIRIEECLKPIAEEYCENKNLVLKSYNSVSFWCSEDLRSQSERYKYLRGEMEMCKINDALHAKGETDGK